MANPTETLGLSIRAYLQGEWRERPERRRLSRLRAADLYVTSSVIDVVVKDLNPRGMSIETRRPLRVGASYPFKFHKGRECMALDGVAKWCRLLRTIDLGSGESQALYGAGIAFSRSLDDF